MVRHWWYFRGTAYIGLKLGLASQRLGITLLGMALKWSPQLTLLLLQQQEPLMPTDLSTFPIFLLASDV